MLSKIPGKGAAYMIAFSDSEGKPLSGGANYKLTLPPNIPAANFWSVTLYEAENASGLANGQPFPSLGSRDKPVENADGSTDLYVGPTAPEGKASNWLATARAGASLRSGASMGRPKLRSIETGSPATSSRLCKREGNDCDTARASIFARKQRHAAAISTHLGVKRLTDDPRQRPGLTLRKLMHCPQLRRPPSRSE